MKKRTLILLYYWLTTLAWAGLIYFLSSQPDLKIVTTDLDEILRKAAHVFFFAIQTILLYRTLLWTVRTKLREFELRKDYDASIIINWLLLTISVLFVVIYAVIDEFHQSLVPTRNGSVVDVLIDGIGILTAAAILFKAGVIAEIEHRFARKGWKIIAGDKYYGE